MARATPTPKKNNAGVGVLVRRTSGVKVAGGKIRTEDFRTARDKGRAAKYHVDADWDTDAVCYVLYGQAGGNNKDKSKTQEIMQACREEFPWDRHCVQFMLGDYNAEPNSLDLAKEMMEDQQWVDVGEKADWWGGTANQ